jgi:transcriptional regulator of acetoin/glycerol metabolism
LSRRIAVETGRPELHVPHAVIDRWVEMEWRGNVRELENAIRRWVALGDDTQPSPWASADVLAAPARTAGMLGPLLKRYEGNLAAVARQLGVTRQAVWKRARRAGLDCATFRAGRSPFAREA